MHLWKSAAAAILATALLTGLGLAASTPIAAQTATPTPTPTLTGTLPRGGGVGLAVWQGGRAEDLPAAATSLGCRLQALWLIRNGEFIGFVYGAPDVVNAPFRTAYPGPIPAGAIIAVCGAPAATTPATTPTPIATATPTPAPSAAVKESMLIIGFIFQRHIEIPVGGSVNWINRDAIQHTVTAKDGTFSSGTLTPGNDFTFTFTKPGTFAYFCSIHPFMTESVVVR